MRRFSEQDVRDILSQDHLRNTAHALGKEPTDVSSDDLVGHWLRHHIPMDVVRFDVEPSPHGDDELMLFV